MRHSEAKTTQKRAAIDWNDVHRRLERSRAALEQGAAPTPEAKKKILRARAKALAREPEVTEAAEAPFEAVEFLLAHERYGLESRYVREVYPLKEFTPLPCTPRFVLGIVNVRGQILSVLDLKKFFDLPEQGLTDFNKVILLQSRTMEFGILADALLGVRRVAPGALQPSLPTLTGMREEFLKGVTLERLIILDAEKLLSSPDVIVREEVEA